MVMITEQLQFKLRNNLRAIIHRFKLYLLGSFECQLYRYGSP